MGAIDLNADLGESVDGVPTADDDAMFAVISSASIACGGHAGDAVSMRESVARARECGVAMGAHPSYPDRPNFGRAAVVMDAPDLRASVAQQLAALLEAGADLQYVKPHGALYHAVIGDAEHARALAAAVADASDRIGRPLPVLGMPGHIARAAADAGSPFVLEAFLDRGYQGDGMLVPRTQPGALLHDADEVAVRAVRLVREGVVETVTGGVVGVDAASLCLHGDTPEAVEMARAVRAALVDAGIAVRAPWSDVT
ncbi:5-oxoprolinase subunit PxpA [Microbacterium sp. C7(2022)]|uniref:5-oxoprolinase subunit PxpA n=1 Tax=Microbacterium sp. C7(2022) TaxID=2992759 RepID=UPI00237C0D90|nr:5-oxoprolinase subunit PxpA [Microbacterium sp. C7(2022)]MDE0545293.1 LamB/YcsF family protein [Microbacterium sp. C7(2022)]